MSKPERLSPKDARERVMAGKALLVCAYDDEQKCASMRLTDSVTLGELPRLQSDDRQLIFYCA